MRHAPSSALELPLLIGSAMILAIASGSSLSACSDDGGTGAVADSGGGAQGDGPTDDATSGGGDSSVEDAPRNRDDASPDSGDASRDSGDGGVTPPPRFCVAKGAAATFCSDFDEPQSLSSDAGASAAWDEVLMTAGTGTLALSTSRSMSAPMSLALTVPAGGGDARLTRSFNQQVQQATYEFDMYIETQPKAANAGDIITDLQFTNDDAYGFRVLIFSKADGSYDHATLEHNNGGAPSDISPITLNAGAWNHIKMNVAFTTVASQAKASLQAYMNSAVTPAVDKSFDAPTATAPMGRIRLGKVFAFGDSQEYKLNFDNVVVTLK